MLVDRYKSGEKLDSGSLFRMNEVVSEWRTRLFDISWYMRKLNKFIARKANCEDNCTDSFWEGRFNHKLY
jgi:hypothetical protein